MKPPREVKDVETFGRSTKFDVVRAGKTSGRNWLKSAPVSEPLERHQIAHLGQMWARPPFRVIRANSSGTFALAGLDGEGETLIDGAWRKVKPGEVCLLPAFVHTGIRTTSKKTWHFAWVRYEEAREMSPILSTSSPVIRKSNVHPLANAIAGLSSEYLVAQPDQTSVHHWVELIHNFVTRAARPFQDDDRLWRLWEAVEKRLAHPWQLGELAEIANLSPEHLRRLCQRQLGRSPIQQITHLRIRRAVDLLTTSNAKVETIAYSIGYKSPFTFSNAFKRWTGTRPSDYREEKKEAPNSDELI